MTTDEKRIRDMLKLHNEVLYHLLSDPYNASDAQNLQKEVFDAFDTIKAIRVRGDSKREAQADDAPDGR